MVVPKVPPPPLSSRPCLPHPPPSPASAPFQDPRSTPLPLTPSGTQTTSLGDKGLPEAPDEGDASARPGPLASPQRPPRAFPRDAGTCREEERLRLPANGLGETKSRVPSPSPSPSRAPARVAPSTCWRRAHLRLRLPLLHTGSPGVGLGASAAEAESAEKARGGGFGRRRQEPSPPLERGLGRQGRARAMQTREEAGARWEWRSARWGEARFLGGPGRLVTAAAPEDLRHRTGGGSREVLGVPDPASPHPRTHTCPAPPTHNHLATKAHLDADRLGPGNQGAGPSRLGPDRPIRPLRVLVPVPAFTTTEAGPPRVPGACVPLIPEGFSQARGNPLPD